MDDKRMSEKEIINVYAKYAHFLLVEEVQHLLEVQHEGKYTLIDAIHDVIDMNDESPNFYDFAVKVSIKEIMIDIGMYKLTTEDALKNTLGSKMPAFRHKGKFYIFDKRFEDVCLK